MQTLLPKRVDHILDSRRALAVTATRRRKGYRGATFEDEAQLVDADGNAVQLGSDAVTPWWSIRGQIRDGKVLEGGPVVGEFLIAILDPVAGTYRYRLLPSVSRLILPDECWYEIDFTNLAHPDYDTNPAFVATAQYGAFHLEGEYADEDS